ncbi:hypothetical protein ORJ66_19555 [Pseudoalteromonas tunicata]|uniref:hypothetical protein n=1 Tax=Pseudoalteromonas tunicata TaxID=314281 RepID=UPI00273D8567|nr:hypothetical protein [Pseudoalteromonas tunicata]MDP5215258.1 hypothetical protein [Pseudoalteromonas tunicata]
MKVVFLLILFSFNSYAHLSWFETVYKNKAKKSSIIVKSYSGIFPFQKQKGEYIEELTLYGLSDKANYYSKNNLNGMLLNDYSIYRINDIPFDVRKVVLTYKTKLKLAKLDRLTGESLPKRYETERVSKYYKDFYEIIDHKYFLGLVGNNSQKLHVGKDILLNTFSFWKPMRGVEIQVFVPSKTDINKEFFIINTDQNGLAKFKPNVIGKYYIRAKFIETLDGVSNYNYESMILEVMDSGKLFLGHP